MIPVGARLLGVPSPPPTRNTLYSEGCGGNQGVHLRAPLVCTIACERQDGRYKMVAAIAYKQQNNRRWGEEGGRGRAQMDQRAPSTVAPAAYGLYRPANGPRGPNRPREPRERDIFSLLTFLIISCLLGCVFLCDFEVAGRSATAGRGWRELQRGRTRSV